MGSEIRKIPKGWQHPRKPNGTYRPLFDNFWFDLVEWNLHKMMWDAGFREDWERKGCWRPIEPENQQYTYEEWDNGCPVEKDYMPDWPAHERTMFVCYETVSEGTPISPAFEKLEDLNEWLDTH